MDLELTDAYLRRIGAARPAEPDAEALRDLQLRHLRSVPFENLSIHLGEDIVLTEKPLIDKIVTARRGGFCYEMNGAFAALLSSLGFGVTLIQARVIGPEGELGIPYDHLVLRVETSDRVASASASSGTGPWLADVGFGDHSHHPLALDERGDQRDPRGTFRIVEGPDGDLDVFRDGTPQYRLDMRPRVLADFTAGSWWHRTSPASHFTRSLVCSRLADDGSARLTLSGRRLVTTVDGERTEQPLATDAEVLAAYRDHFGIALDRVPVVRTPAD
ncbi:arylamine N-acetyltransferase [Streptomyces sp. H27-C3]|uniref:arylamine N-acetyltransferase family protein n=1 Tax=Streptomyces sp. H27-C3 TaxID=3046305 RepID=UPI0024B9D3F7|nr:arylamine N-acetyltransferase [Streptomyces sp. H27-C3]MDJ0464538.1 arylamine N-acetyltransferase [Streptomyces sp. H27-C3]